MEEHFPDSALKPIINRVRHHHKRSSKKRKCHPCDKKTDTNMAPPVPKKRHSSMIVGLEGISVDNLRDFVSTSIQEMDMGRIAELKEEVNTYVKQMLCPMMENKSSTSMEAWFNKLDRDDINHLLSITDPVAATVEHIMTLPNTLDKICNVSSLDIHPTVYHKDHFWLSLQWMIDDVQNPFLSRPCMSKPCLGEYVQDENGCNNGTPLPEMVPVTLLDKMREYRSQGHSMLSFHHLLKEKRLSSRHIASDFTLGVDLWPQPKCILCYIGDAFSKATCQGFGEDNIIGLNTYQRNYLIQFPGMRADMMVNFDHLSISWKLEETGVSLPKIVLPLPASVVSLLTKKENSEINVDALYQ